MGNEENNPSTPGAGTVLRDSASGGPLFFWQTTEGRTWVERSAKMIQDVASLGSTVGVSITMTHGDDPVISMSYHPFEAEESEVEMLGHPS